MSGAKKIAIAGGLLAALAVAVLALWPSGGGDIAGPGPLVQALLETDWVLPRDPETGYRRLSTPIGGQVEIAAAALGDNGDVAFAVVREYAPTRVVIFRSGEVETHELNLGYDVNSMAVDPEGNVYVGMFNGRFAQVSPDGVLTQIEAVEERYSLVGFAFDRNSDRTAVMLSGGGVHTAMRPFDTRNLVALPMPERARIRRFAFDSDSELVIAGDAGAVFHHDGESWDENSVPGGADVVALGTAANGDTLCAADDGFVYATSGYRWERLGRIGVPPIAVGEMRDYGVVVVGNDGSIHALYDRDDFSEVSGYEKPSEFSTHYAQVSGSNVLMVGRERVLIWDGAVWDSADQRVASPPGATPLAGCRVVGGPRYGSATGSDLLSCGSDLAFVRGGEIAPVTEITSRGDASAWAVALGQASRRPSAWVGEELWWATASDQLPGLIRNNDATGDFDPVAHFELEGGRVLSVSADRNCEGSCYVWTAHEDGSVRRAIFAGESHDSSGEASAPFEVVADVSEFHALYTDSLRSDTASIHALGAGVALVAHRGGIVTRVGVGEPEALILQSAGTGSPTYVETDLGVFAAYPGSLTEVPATGDPVAWTVPPEWTLPADERHAVVSGAGAIWIREDRTGNHVLRCRDRQCQALPLPINPRALLVDPEGKLVVLEAGGLVGLFEP